MLSASPCRVKGDNALDNATSIVAVHVVEIDRTGLGGGSIELDRYCRTSLAWMGSSPYRGANWDSNLAVANR